MPRIDLGPHDLLAKQKASRLHCSTCGSRAVHSFDPDTRNDIIMCPQCPDGGTLEPRKTMTEREEGYANEGAMYAMTNTAVEQVAQEQRTVDALLENPTLRKALEETLPRKLTIDRFLRTAMTSIRKVPKLRECTAASLFGALLQAAQLDIEPDTPLELCHLIPYGKEATLIVTYKGYIALGYRSGKIQSFDVGVVREGDRFEWTQGSDARCDHTPITEAIFKQVPNPAGGPNITIATGENVTHAYAVAHLVGGGHVQAVLTHAQIEAHRSHSRAAKSGPWVTHWEEQAKKTAVRVLRKIMPMSIDAKDWDTAERVDEQPTHFAGADAIETTWSETVEAADKETGEVEPATIGEGIPCAIHGEVNWLENQHGGFWHSTPQGEASCNPGIALKHVAEETGWTHNQLNEYLKEQYDVTASKITVEQMVETQIFLRERVAGTAEAPAAEQPAPDAAPAAEDAPQVESDAETGPEEAPVTKEEEPAQPSML